MGNINIQPPPAAENQNSSMMDQQHQHQHPQHATESTRHLERLLAAATILNPMGNIGPESHPYYYPSSTVRHHPFHHGPSSPTSSIHSGRSYSSLSIANRTKNAGLQHLCSLVTFLLGGPMPPTPGVIPMCWEELVDWTEEATAMTESVDSHYHNNIDDMMMSRDEAFNPKPLFPFSNSNSNTVNNNHGIQFVPYVAIFESNESLKKLASQTYMERARFYQESVIIAVKQTKSDDGNHHHNGNNKDEVLCLISLFQFCRYFTLLRRISDSQALLLEYPPVKLVGKVDSSLLTDDNDGRHSVTDTTEQDPLTMSNLGDPLLQSQCANNNTTSIPGSLWLTQSPSELLEEEELEKRQPPPPLPRLLVEECAICMDKPEYAVLNCCSHGLCRDCEKQWVRKRLCCPFCRKSFKSVKDVVQTQWQLSVTAVPVEQVRNDIACLEHKIRQFWKSVPMASGGEGDDCGRHSATEMASILAENYVERPRSIVSHDDEPVSSSLAREEVEACDNPARCEAEEGFVVIQQLSLVVGTAI